MEYRWKALGVVSIGSLMGAIDATVLIIAFPQIARDLSASLVSMVWVLMVYILMGTALVLSLGRISDLKGRKRMYGAAFGVFVLGSALCGLSQNGPELVVFRGLQGIGGAMLVANSFAILSDAFPPNERGRAFGINSIVWGTGSVFGIVLGGLILAVTSWRWIFWINVPIGVVGVFLARAVLRESASPDPKESFDLPAAILFTAGLGAALLGLTEALLTSWIDPLTLVPLVLAVPLFAAFFLWEGRWSRDPILPFRLFRQWLFTASLAASVLQGVALFAANFLLMIYFQGIRGVSVVTAAYLLIPLSVALGVVGPIGGRLSDRYGARVLSTVGLMIQGSVFVLFSTIQASTPLATVALYEALLGVGGGLFFPANTSAVMLGVPRRQYGVASGVMMTVRNASMTLSYTLGLVALTSQLPAGAGAALFGGAFTSTWAASLGYTPGQLNGLFLTGMHAAFHLAAGFVFAAAVFSALRGSEDRGVQLGTAHHRHRRPARDGGVSAPLPP